MRLENESRYHTVILFFRKRYINNYASIYEVTINMVFSRPLCAMTIYNRCGITKKIFHVLK